MVYTKAELAQLSGLGGRTITNYVRRGLLPKPRGHGLSATYSEEAYIRAVAIGRMLREGDGINAIEERVARWSIARFRRFVGETDSPGAREPRSGAMAGTDAADPPAPAKDPITDLALPAGPTFRMVSLLPGLGLILESTAPPVVHRVAAEICERYGRR